MSRVMHFEIHASQPQALIDYYTALFGWTISKWEGAEGFDYWMIETGAAGAPGINGGLLRRHGAAPAEGQSVNAFVCTVGVESVDAILAKNAELGGRVALPKQPIKGMGWLAYLLDPDGNVLGVMQPDTGAA